MSTCQAGSEDLNRVMVENGWATAYREYSLAYEWEEAQAKSKGLGIWSSEFQLPENFRHSTAPKEVLTPMLRRSNRASFSRCVIKGNRNRRGQWIYHLPGMPYYDATRPEEIFCTEAEAQAAGYRRAMVRP